MTLDRLPHDRRLAKRLARDARAAGRARARAELGHARAVQRRADRAARGRRDLPGQLVLALGAAVASVPLDGGLAVVATVTAGWSAMAAYRSVSAVRRPPVPPLLAFPAAPAAAPPPHPRSAAWPAVRRLEVVREELARLLPLVAPAGRDAAQEAWSAAAEADGALRWQAARFAAVEPHRGTDPELLRLLHDGVASQERMLAAVADLVAASADPLATARLQDVTDVLHGLAMGLRELR